MSKLMKINIIQVVSWSIVAIGVLIIFSLLGTIEQWGDNRIKTILLALLFLLGYTLDFGLRMYEKSKKWGFRRDERDRVIQSEAMSVGFVILVLYIFILSIFLYTKYETDGFMPIGWVWLIAYSTVVVANLSVGVSSLLLYRKQGY